MRVAAVVVLALTLAACTTGKSALTKVEPTTAAPAVAVPPAPTSPTVAPPSSGAGAGEADYCANARSFAKAFERFGQPGTAAEKRAYYQSATAAMPQAVASAPAEIRADVQVLAAVLGALVSALERIDYDAARITSLPPDVIARLMSQEVTVALSRVTIYHRDRCGIT